MANVRHWVAWAEQKIAGVVVTEGLHCGLCEVKQGPLTITFRVRLLKPTPASLKKVLSLAPALAQTLQVDDVRMADTARGILIEIPSPQPRTPSGQHLAQYTHDLIVAVGLDQWRQPVQVELRHHPTLLFVGPPRRGKTSAMKSILYALARQNPPERLRYAIIGQRRHDWLAFENAAGCLGVISDPAEAVHVMEWAAGRLLAQRSKRGHIGTAVVFVLDDLTNLLKRAPEIATPIGEIATMGGGVNLFQLIGTHHAGSKAGTGDSNLEASATARIVYKPSSTSTGSRSAGTGGLALDLLSSHKGDCLFILDGQPRRVATAHTDDRVILRLPAGNGVVTPWSIQREDEGTIGSPLSDQNRTVTTSNQAQISQNQVEPAVTPDLDMPRNAGREPENEGNIDSAPEPVSSVIEKTFPIASRPPIDAEVAVIRAFKAQGYSLNKLCRTVYGGKNDRILAWIKEALAVASADDKDSEHLTEQSGPVSGNSIDLNTSEGKTAMDALMRTEVVNWQETTKQLGTKRLIHRVQTE
jgi:hypothetical protein